MRIGVLYGALIALVSVVCGCSHDTNAVVTDDGVMRFGTAKLSDSRAVLNSVSDMAVDGNSFGVCAAYTNTNWSSYNTLIANEEVTYNGGSWSYDMLRMWVPGMSYRFRAFFPYADQSSAAPLYKLSYASDNSFNYTLSNFIVNQTVENQVDLLVSDVVMRGPIKPLTEADDQRSEVAFTFTHLLTNVNFELFKADGVEFDMKLLTVRLIGMYNSGTCNSGVWQTSGSVDMSAGYYKAYALNEGYLKCAADVVGNEALVWSDGLLMIPQTVTPDMSLIIDFQIEKEVEGLSERRVYNKRSVLPLPITYSWNNNQKITYTAKITSDESIVFAPPTVTPWIQSQSGGMVIIK